MQTQTEILECGHAFTTGYGVKKVEGKEIRCCYECCAADDAQSMRETGRATLYLTGSSETGYRVTNWPNSLSFTVGHSKIGRHNIARTRRDVYFRGPDGKAWHGVTYGKNTQ